MLRVPRREKILEMSGMKLIGKRDENTENDLNTNEEDINEIVDQLFPEILGSSECDRARYTLHSSGSKVKTINVSEN